MKCEHEWIVTVDDDNFPEDVMCKHCCEVVIMVDKTEPIEDFDKSYATSIEMTASDLGCTHWKNVTPHCARGHAHCDEHSIEDHPILREHQ